MFEINKEPIKLNLHSHFKLWQLHITHLKYSIWFTETVIQSHSYFVFLSNLSMV